MPDYSERCELRTREGQRCALRRWIRIRWHNGGDQPWEGWVCGNHRNRCAVMGTVEVLEQRTF